MHKHSIPSSLDSVFADHQTADGTHLKLDLLITGINLHKALYWQGRSYGGARAYIYPNMNMPPTGNLSF